MSTTIVTGAAGWLGRRLVLLLAGRGAGPVRTMDLGPPVAPPASAGSPLEALTGDVRNRDDCRRLLAAGQGATVFHLAGVIHPARVRDFYAVNVTGTRNVLAAAAEAGARRVVVMSSNSPLGCNPHPDHLFDEESPYRPYMNYGRSKMLMEMAAQEAQGRGNLETVIVRAPWFYGPGQPPRQKLFFEMIRKGRGPIVGGGDNLRSMAYVDDLAAGLVLAGSVQRAAGETYWIADERPYSMNEIVDLVERLLETEFHQRCAHRRLRLPGLASEVAWLCDWLLQACGAYNQKIHVLSEMNKTIACSIDKARRELGYAPRIGLEEGMRRSLAELY